jgi:hypothetical protein
MTSGRARAVAERLTPVFVAAVLAGLLACEARAAPDFSGVWGIGGAAMEVVQQPQRITLLSELANQSRRIFLDGRAMPDSFPDQRVGFSVGHWEGDTLVIETSNVSEWQAPRWPHSGEFHVTERWRLDDPAKLKITGLRTDRPPPKIEGKILVNEMTMNDPQAKN